jgi:hypothetical protein
MALSDIVNVVVTINQSTVAQQGFGTPLIFGNVPWTDVVRTYNANDWATALATDLAGGYEDPGVREHAVYQTAAAIMRQSPRPSTFKVGRQSKTVRQSVRLSIADEGPYALSIDSPLGATHRVTAGSVAGLVSAINDESFPFDLTATAAEQDALVVADNTECVYSFHSMSGLSLRDVTVSQDDETGSIGSDLDRIQGVDGDWYGLMLSTAAPAVIASAAAWVEGNRKIMVASTHDMGALLSPQPAANEPAGDVFEEIDRLNYARTHVAYHSRAAQFYGPAWMAAVMTFEPGAVDWKFKTLRGVTSDKLTGTSLTNLRDRGGSFYENPVRGVDMTGAATGGDGVFLDLTQLSDWTVARIQEGIVAMLAASPKTAFTDEDGGNKIWGVLNNVVQMGIRNGAIDDEPDTFRIYVPKRAELAPPDRAARRWQGCSLSYRPTGAVHSVGTINVLLNVA